MGWSSGSSLMSEVIDTIRMNVKSHKARKLIYEDIIPAFEYEDCDSLYECYGEDDAFDEALDELHEEEDDEEDEGCFACGCTCNVD